MATQKGELFSLQVKDFIKGSVIAFGAALLPSIYTLLDKDHFPTWVEFAPYLKSALSAMIVYILKNYLSNSNGDFLKKEPVNLPYNKTEP